MTELDAEMKQYSLLALQFFNDYKSNLSSDILLLTKMLRPMIMISTKPNGPSV